MALIGGVAAILSAVALLVGAAGLAFGAGRGRPWLLVLFGFNAQYRVSSRDELRGINAIDVALLVLAGAAYAGFWPGPGTSHVGWMALAVAQPLLGVLVLMATRLAGRSGLMGGGLALSILMLVDGTAPAFSWVGVSASLLLLVGDFGTTARPSRILAVALALGYPLLIVWFAFLAALLL